MVLMKYLYFYIKSLISHPKKVLRIKHGLRKAVKFVSNEIEQCGFFQGNKRCIDKEHKGSGGTKARGPHRTCMTGQPEEGIFLISTQFNRTFNL